MTDIKNKNGWVCFDADCGFCLNLVRRFANLLHRHRFGLLPLQTPWVRRLVTRHGEELLAAMCLITTGGRIHRGADALIQIARKIWWARPVYWFSQVTVVERALHTGYAWVARHRACHAGTCRLEPRRKSTGLGVFNWILAVLPTALVLGLGNPLPGWAWMWAIAFAIFIGAKWVTLQSFLRSSTRTSPGRLLAYVFLWPGMDPRSFCATRPLPRPTANELAGAAANTIFGAGLIWIGARSVGVTHLIAMGWVGMFGIVLVLHFGLFNLLSAGWRALGLGAHPIMRSPADASSLSSFWGQSWNGAFSDLMHEYAFKPLTRTLGPRAGLLLAFLVSGGLHELVISIPARGGYGLPTAYFIFQGFALLFERSRFGRKLGLSCGLKGRCFVALTAGVPAFWLFHPLFVRRVILPMLEAIGAIS